MSRPFRLASLLRLRTMAEDRAAVELASANRVRSTAEHRRSETAVQLGAASMPLRGDTLHWQAAVASRAALGGLLVEHRAAVEVADEDVHVADEAWSQARSRTRALEKLEERHVAEVRAEEEHAEQVALDEVGSRIAEVARAAARAAAQTDVHA